MSTSLPLEGRRVFIPRGQKQSGSFSKLVREYGGVPLEIPLIEFRPVGEEQLKNVVQSLSTYDWMIFTSKVTVDIFFSYIDKALPLPKIAVIGSKTEEAILEKGYPVDFLPKEYVAEGFIREFIPIVPKGSKVLIPKGNLARDYISTRLRSIGVEVDEIIVYETFFPEESKLKLRNLLESGIIDILAFTSPSTIENFMSIVNKYELHHSLEGALIVCIGPVARKKAESFGLKVQVMPEKYTVYEMVKSLILYIENTSKYMEADKL
ncbi:uroporphyrinogen-III synthase [Bacillus massilinigeriensis]|uniref:uroporphyrinogen-III synthase n=1 Tax=Bacillus massilionigeriensis TaxID=1805475 RepID=UPI00096B5E4E|nr:uroporphyrinogen-III synthase [Bacillus massilionigeriensis]